MLDNTDMNNEEQKEKSNGKLRGKLSTPIAIVAVIIALLVIGGGTLIYGAVSSSNGGNGNLLSQLWDSLFGDGDNLTASGHGGTDSLSGMSSDELANMIQAYTMEYLGAPPASEKVKQLTRDELMAYGDVLGTYYTNKNVDPNMTLAGLEGDILNQFSDEQIKNMDQTLLQQLIDASIAMALGDIPDYASIIDELRTKYDNELNELRNLFESLESSYTELKQFTENNTMSVTDAKVIEVTINELKQTLTQVENQLQQFEQFETTINQQVEELNMHFTDEITNLQSLINETNNSMNEMYVSFQQDLQTLEQLFGDNLTEVYNILENNITNLTNQMNQQDQQLQQNIWNEQQAREKDVADLNQLLEETAGDLMNQLQETANRLDAADAELQNNIDITNTRLTNEVNNLYQYIEETVNTAIDKLTGDLNDLKEYTNQHVENLYQTIYDQYHWSTDSDGQTVLTVITPEPSN